MTKASLRVERPVHPLGEYTTMNGKKMVLCEYVGENIAAHRELTETDQLLQFKNTLQGKDNESV